jgi:uncharacterized protein (DUF305 family)
MTKRRSPLADRWIAALLLGLLSSTYSTLMSQLMAARIGRDAATDWMVVAAIPLRDGVLQVDPSWDVILAGIAFHQWADISWALVFFGLLGRWTARLAPLAILAVALPWAVLTSALEWFVLVPAVPFLQPVFPLEQPYWIGLLVHLTSASLYPLFPWLRDRVAGAAPTPHRHFIYIWSVLALAGALVLGTLAFLGWLGREVPLPSRHEAFDRTFMRRMAAHHEQGIRLARLAAERTDERRLARLARLMAAQQIGDNAILAQWWRGWYGGDLPGPAREDYAMPGMLTPTDMQRAEEAAGASFDRLFVRLMTRHHEGAIAMADEALREAGDPRLKLMAHAIRHSQRGEIALMHGVAPGFAATRAAWRAMTAPAGAAHQ